MMFSARVTSAECNEWIDLLQVGTFLPVVEDHHTLLGLAITWHGGTHQREFSKRELGCLRLPFEFRAYPFEFSYRPFMPVSFSKPRTLVSWSSGKDSAWMLYQLQQHDDVEIVGLLTSFNEAADRVAMHAVRRTLVEAQAEAAGLPLWPVLLPWPCTNADYEARMAQAFAHAETAGVTHIAFGDLFLEDIRAYREQQLAGTGLQPLFPIWHPDGGTSTLAQQMVAAGLRAMLTCIDPNQLAPSFVGRTYDAALLADLPATADPCGENGEFHTFCHTGPMFAQPIPVTTGEVVHRDGFWYADVLPGRPDLNGPQ